MLNRRKKIITLILMAVYALIIFAPPIYHGYVYPNGGDDTALHLTIIKSGDLFKQIYAGYIFVGYPLRWLNALTGISINWLFFWFNYLVLFMVGVTNSLVASKLAGWKAGLLGLFIPAFLTQGIMYQFDFGQVFNIINMGIIFPCLIYFAVKWYKDRWTYYLYILVGLDLLMATFHSTGVYLAPLILIVVMVNLLYQWAAKKEIWLAVGNLAVLAPINLVLQYFTMNRFTADVMQMGLEKGKELPLWFIGKILPVTVLIALGIALIVKRKKYSLQVKVVGVIIGAFAIMLFGVIFFKLSFVPDRQLYDVVTPIGLIAAILMGRLKAKEFPLAAILVAVTVAGGLPNWFAFHNAVKEPDKQAFAYLNSLKTGTFSVSSEVTPNIYWNYVKHGYVEEKGDYLVWRSYPQTACSDPESEAYVPHGADKKDYIISKTFTDGVVIVNVYWSPKNHNGTDVVLGY